MSGNEDHLIPAFRRLPSAGWLVPLKSRRSGERDLRYYCLPGCGLG